MNYNEVIAQFFTELFKGAQDPQKIEIRIILSCIVLVISLSLYYLLKKWSFKQDEDIKKTRRTFLTSKYLLICSTIILFFAIWLKMIGMLLVTAFLLGFILFLFVKGGVSNIAGGIVILNKSYFKIYDQIEVDGTKGIVLSVHLFHFVLMEIANWFDEDTPTGRTIKIPNNVVLTHKVFNFNDINPFIWKEVKFPLTFESDWKKAENIMEAIVVDYLSEFEQTYFKDPKFKEKILKQLQIYDGSLLPKKVVNVTNDGIVIKIRFIVYYKNGTTTTTMVNENILEAFSKEEEIVLSGRQIYIQ